GLEDNAHQDNAHQDNRAADRCCHSIVNIECDNACVGKETMPRKWCPTIARIATVAIAVTIVNSASATVRITDDYGGVIGDYLDRFKSVRDSGERVIIDGLCLSACTLVLGIVPQDHICVTSRARLGFHAAWRSATGSLKATGSLQV